MGTLNHHALRLSVKLLSIGVVTAVLTWYLVENPSTPAVLAVCVWLLGFFGIARAFLSEAEAFVLEVGKEA